MNQRIGACLHKQRWTVFNGLNSILFKKTFTWHVHVVHFDVHYSSTSERCLPNLATHESMYREYVAMGTSTLAWHRKSIWRVYALVSNTCSQFWNMLYTYGTCITGISDQSCTDPPWRGARLVQWREGRFAFSSLKEAHGDNGGLGDSPGPFTINKTCSIPCVITGSSMSSSSPSASKPVFARHKVEALLPQLLSYIKGNINLHSTFMLQLPNEQKGGQCYSICLRYNTTALNLHH